MKVTYSGFSIAKNLLRVLPMIALGGTCIIFQSCASIERESPASGVDLDISSIQEIEVITDGLSVGCDVVTIRIAGRLLYKGSDGRKRPLRDAVLWKLDEANHPERLSVEVKDDGSFRGSVAVWDHYVGPSNPNSKKKVKYIPGKAVIEIRARGCDSKRLSVGHRWRDKKILLKCPDR